MKRYILFTLILVAATVFITVKYFRSLSSSGTHAGDVIRNIPGNASAVFEFTNDKGFYEIFANNTLLGNLIGENQMGELDTVRKQLFSNAAIHQMFDDSHIFISLHPAAGHDNNLLITAASGKEFDRRAFDDFATQKHPGILITPLSINEKKGYTVFFTALKKRFYIINKDGHIYTASFSKPLIEQSALHKATDLQSFTLLPDQQNSTSLANLYVNYQQLSPLFDELFSNKTSDIFKSFRLLPASAALNLNFKSDALMFNGYTNLQPNKPSSYLNLFAMQQPVDMQLIEIYPSTTAYAMEMAVSDPQKFEADLNSFHDKAGINSDRDPLLARIKTETGINIKPEFGKRLSNEFAVVTTRYREKFALIKVKDGLDLRPFMTNISNMITDDVGQFKYNKLPYYLLGDAFNGFPRPYFRIIDNYLLLANSLKEIESYNDSYLNRKFLSRTGQYERFNNLLAERCNIAFIINFKNAQPLLKHDLANAVYDAYIANKLSVKNFYGASYQLTAADKNFYTNFCMIQNQIETTSTADNAEKQ